MCSGTFQCSFFRRLLLRLHSLHPILLYLILVLQILLQNDYARAKRLQQRHQQQRWRSSTIVSLCLSLFDVIDRLFNVVDRRFQLQTLTTFLFLFPELLVIDLPVLAEAADMAVGIEATVAVETTAIVAVAAEAVIAVALLVVAADSVVPVDHVVVLVGTSLGPIPHRPLPRLICRSTRHSTRNIPQLLLVIDLKFRNGNERIKSPSVARTFPTRCWSSTSFVVSRKALWKAC